MHAVAPNLSALIGELVGARLISHAGSLTNLAKYPASTVQILGAEKALFRCVLTRAGGAGGHGRAPRPAGMPKPLLACMLPTSACSAPSPLPLA